MPNRTVRVWKKRTEPKLKNTFRTPLIITTKEELGLANVTGDHGCVRISSALLFFGIVQMAIPTALSKHNSPQVKRSKPPSNYDQTVKDSKNTFS